MKTFIVTLLAVLVAVGSSGAIAQTVPPGAMLQQGEWRGGVGSYDPPQIWSGKPVTSWPLDGWAQLDIDQGNSTLTVGPMTEDVARRRLKPIWDQLLQLESPPSQEDSTGDPIQPPPGTERDIYARVPGLTWQAVTVPLHRFKNGTPSLIPEMGRRYELAHAGRPFAFTLQNGFRTPDGRPYGSGTQFTLEVGGNSYAYDLGGYGWEARILAMGDFDGDGKPDFVFYIGDSNSSHLALVLSSQAKPGKNPPTAYLTSTGC